MENDRRQRRTVPEILEELKTFPQTGAPNSAEPALLGVAQESKVEIMEANAYSMQTSAVSAADAEAKELEAVKATIRSFVRMADKHAAQVVPLPDGNIELTDAEAEAFFVDYKGEKSFRADCAALHVDIAAIDARLEAQLAAFDKTRQTPYNWKPHADALAHLLSEGKKAAERAMDLAALARERGLNQKADALLESIERIRPRGRAAVEALQLVGGRD
jgi:hypothetical protein